MSEFVVVEGVGQEEGERGREQERSSKLALPGSTWMQCLALDLKTSELYTPNRHTYFMLDHLIITASHIII